MKRRNILLKAFEIMLENHENDFDFCHDIKDCDECPFYRWDICPNFIKEVIKEKQQKVEYQNNCTPGNVCGAFSKQLSVREKRFQHIVRKPDHCHA